MFVPHTKANKIEHLIESSIELSLESVEALFVKCVPSVIIGLCITHKRKPCPIKD